VGKTYNNEFFGLRNTKKSNNHRRTELSWRIQSFLEDYFKPRVKSPGMQRIVNLSFVLRRWAGVSRKMLIGLYPALHFSRQHAQFFLNQILHAGRNKDGDNTTPFLHAQKAIYHHEVLKWVPATEHRMQQGAIINRFVDNRGSLTKNRYLSLKQDIINYLPRQFTGIQSLTTKGLKFIQILKKIDVLTNLRSFEKFVKRESEIIKAQRSRNQVSHPPPVPLRRGIKGEEKVSLKTYTKKVILQNNTRETQRENLKTVGTPGIFSKNQEEDYAGQDNSSWRLKSAFPMTKQVFRKFSTNKEYYHESTLSYVFTHKQQEFISMMKSYRQVDEKELVKRIQRQVHEETRELEKKFSAQAFSPAEITDQVYNHLTKRLLVEKERLGY
jgi:hypothetical protein